MFLWILKFIQTFRKTIEHLLCLASHGFLTSLHSDESMTFGKEEERSKCMNNREKFTK